ncbi:MAG: hypothetical protein ABIG85_08085 [Chloroflexota bacterium]
MRVAVGRGPMPEFYPVGGRRADRFDVEPTLYARLEDAVVPVSDPVGGKVFTMYLALGRGGDAAERWRPYWFDAGDMVRFMEEWLPRLREACPVRPRERSTSMKQSELQAEWDKLWDIALEVAKGLGVELAYAPKPPSAPQEEIDAHRAEYAESFRLFAKAFDKHLRGLDALPIPLVTPPAPLDEDPLPPPGLPLTREPDDLEKFRVANNEWVDATKFAIEAPFHVWQAHRRIVDERREAEDEQSRYIEQK